MATSEKLLTVIAIRLAVLLVAGVVARAAADRPSAQATYLTSTVAVDLQTPSAGRPEGDEVLPEILLHD